MEDQENDEGELFNPQEIDFSEVERLRVKGRSARCTPVGVLSGAEVHTGVASSRCITPSPEALLSRAQVGHTTDAIAGVWHPKTKPTSKEAGSGVHHGCC